MRKSPVKITRAIGITKGVNLGVTISRPSTAERTDIAGVITPSPYKSAAPKRPVAISVVLVVKDYQNLLMILIKVSMT